MTKKEFLKEVKEVFDEMTYVFIKNNDEYIKSLDDEEQLDSLCMGLNTKIIYKQIKGKR